MEKASQKLFFFVADVEKCRSIYCRNGSDFSIQSWKDVLKLSPADNSAKEELALALFYKETKSFEGFKLFNNLFDLEALSSIFSLSVAVLCAFEVDERGYLKKWTEKLTKEISKNESQIMPEELYPGYSALIINSIFNKEKDKIVLYLQKLEELKRFSFPNFAIFDDRTIRALKDFGYGKEAKSYADKIVSTTDDEEIKKVVSIIFAGDCSSMN